MVKRVGTERAQRRRDRCEDPTRLLRAARLRCNGTRLLRQGKDAAASACSPATCPPRPGTGEGAAASTQNGGYETRAARPPAFHMAAPPQTSQARPRPGAQTPASPEPPLTHRPVAQDGDLPGLGLRHLGGLLSPGPTTLTAAAAAAPPAQTIGGGCAGGTRHTERGGGGRGCLSLARSFSCSLNRPEPNARALPQQHTHVTARGRVCTASRRRLPARNARGCVGGTFYFKGKKWRRPRPPGKVTTETRCVMTLPPTSAAF